MDGMPNLQQENNELKSRLRVFAAILRLTRDAFSFPNTDEVAVHIVNNSKSLLAYERSALVELRKQPKVLAEFAQTNVNQHTEYAQSLRKLCRAVQLGDIPIELSAEKPPEGKISDAVKRAWEFLTADGMHLILIPLRSAKYKMSQKDPYIWVLEYKDKIPGHVPATLSLLASDYGSALWLHLPHGGAHTMLRWLSKITFTRVFVLLLVAFLISLFTVDVEHTVSAEFVVKPQAAYTSYAWFDCVIKRCHFQDGAMVKEGDTILTYDTDRMRFQLAAAKASFKEADAEYEQESKAAFTDRERLGRLKILSYKREQAQIAIVEANWYLAHSTVKAPVNGMLTLADGSADKLERRALRTGEKQFDIFTGTEMVAEIRVNEKDASVLDTNPKILLFLHTRPEVPIQVKLISTRFYPELTEQNTYCYTLKVQMAEKVKGIRYGMRGVARVTGEKVKLGYYLFRSLVLWYRGL